MENVLKYIRRSPKYDLTQNQLAVAIGLSRQTIVKIENGGNVTSETMFNIANYFGLEVKDIFFTNSVAYETHKKISS